MNVDKKILDRINELINATAPILATRQNPGPNMIGFDSWVDGGMVRQWGVNCLNLLSRVFGTDSVHYAAFKEDFDKRGNELGRFKRAIGTLKAAKDDYEHDFLFDTRRLIQAEVFGDFIEQAEHLQQQGYHGPAAVVAGAVLEDGLRKLCAQKSISLPPQPKLDWMNTQLAGCGAYSLLIQKRITTLADIRNNAAHGNWTAFTSTDVQDMMRDVRRFMEEHFR